ncbi:MAG: DUF4435 domain-containing protein [Actinobacteria bacterium]|nr:DUF4435 domain-containing protein [Actinomycetota bacterium]
MVINALNTSKTPGIIVTEIRMMNSTFRGIHFLVEGIDDSKFWKHRLNSDNVAIVNCEGKLNLLGAAADIFNSSISGVAGIYDADFDRLLGISHSPNFVVPTDANDLEISLLMSGALNIFLSEYADAELLDDFENTSGISVAEQIERTSREFGRLRFLSKVAGHRVDFDQLSPYRFVSIDDWSLDHKALKNEYAALASIDTQDLEAMLESQCSQVAPAWAYSQGHDAVRILARGIRRVIGRRQMDEQDVARVLRIAYSKQMLEQTDMYALLCVIQEALPLPLFA